MLTFGSLFAGIGGFDRGLELSGLRCAWQVEIDKWAVSVLERHWPGVKRYGDIRGVDPSELAPVHVLCGGDPCPFRSRARARAIHGTDSADLWPEFLRIVSGLRPLWVLREHVPAPDADDCAAMLAGLGYSVVILEMDGAEITGQRRPREYLCGVLDSAGICPVRTFSRREGSPGHSPPGHQEERAAGCLTASVRFEASDNYLLEPGRGLRILDPVERERLQGFDDGWTDRLSDRQRARVIGNAVMVPKARWIGRRILESTGATPS